MYLRLGLRMMLLLLDSPVTPLLQWWKQLLSLGPLYGFHPTAAKTYLTVKPQLYDSAKQLFQDTNIQITCHGQCHLSAAAAAAIGTQLFTEEYACIQEG